MSGGEDGVRQEQGNITLVGWALGVELVPSKWAGVAVTEEAEDAAAADSLIC